MILFLYWTLGIFLNFSLSLSPPIALGWFGISIVVNEDFVQTTIDAIIKSAATENVGDGKIFILPVDEAFRIRTGEKGNESLN